MLEIQKNNNALETPCLVVNKTWTPINFRHVGQAISDVYAGKAKIIDTYAKGHPDPVIAARFMERFTWQQWIEQDVLRPDLVLKTGRCRETGEHLYIQVPRVITLLNYNDVKDMEIKLNRKNVFARDKHVCQYCGKKFATSNLTLDHVQPRSKGGKNSWDNLTTCCKSCNVRKADKTTYESGMFPRTKPHRPKWNGLSVRLKGHFYEEWEDFITRHSLGVA